MATSPEFFFAWVDEDEHFDEGEHLVEDEQIFSFEITHAEGEFAQLALDVINPRVGLLSLGRQVWAVLSVRYGTSVHVLIRGRLIGVPQQLQAEVVRLTFLARPPNWEALRAELADDLKVEPFWDPLFLTERALLDPDVVLEARPQLWHIDRVTHEVSASNIIEGEDGTQEVDGDFFYDSLHVTHRQTPASVVNVAADVSWQQKSQRSIEIASRFPRKGIFTYTGDGLLSRWPDPGTKIGKAWEVVRATPRLKNGRSFVNDRDQVILTQQLAKLTQVAIGVQTFEVGLALDRGYTERLTFSLTADVQPLLTEPGEEAVDTVHVSANADTILEEESGLSPIRSDESRRYFQGERGQRSLKYLIMLARARLLHRARAVDIAFEIPFEDGLDMSCRRNVQLLDPRLPGGIAIGKIKAYTLSLNGDTGASACLVTIGCTIGRGGTIDPVDGSPTYVEDGYCAAGYVYRANQTFDALDDVVTYEDFSDVDPTDDGFDIEHMNASNAVIAVTTDNEADEQMEKAGGELADAAAEGGRIFTVLGQIDTQALADAINQNPTTVTLEMVTLAPGPFETPIPVTVSVLKIPKTLDLEAA